MGKRGMHVRKSITINRPIDEVYAFWRNFENLPRIMSHLQSVQVTDERQSHWKTEGPAGRFVEWDAVIVADTPNEIISWQSVEGADIPNRGAVHFRPAPGGRGTEITVELDFEAPGGSLGRTFAKLFGKDPAQQIASDLRRLKQLLETGEVIRSEATVAGSGLIQRPAQPADTTQQHAA